MNKKTESELMKPHKDSFRVSPEDDQAITKEKIRKLLPRNSHVKITDEVMDLIYNMGKEIDLPQNLLEEDLMSYMHLVGKEGGGRTSITDVINAVKFCNLKRNYTLEKAWSIVFPHRYDKLIQEGRQVASHVSMYNGSKIVMAIDREMLIPWSLQYATYGHAAIKKQFEIMNGNAGVDANGDPLKVSPMVMHLAAKELALITKQPEEQTLSINVNPGEEAISAQRDMNTQLSQLVAMQKKRLEAGEDIMDVQVIEIDFNGDE